MRGTEHFPHLAHHHSRPPTQHPHPIKHPNLCIKTIHPTQSTNFQPAYAPLPHPIRNRPNPPHLPTRAGLRRHQHPCAALFAAAKRAHCHVAQRQQLLSPRLVLRQFCARHMAATPSVYPRMQSYLATSLGLPCAPLWHLPCAARRLHRPSRLSLSTPARQSARFSPVQHGAASANHRRFFHAKNAAWARRCRAQTRVAALFTQSC